MQKQHRIRLPHEEVAEVVRWLDGAQAAIEAVGVPGAMGGLLVQPLELHLARTNDVRAALRSGEPTTEDGGEPWVDVARLLATEWLLNISIESGRVSITLPEPARAALRLPAEGGTIVVFGFGDLFEIWDGDAWTTHARSLRQKGESVLVAALTDLTGF